MRNVDILYHNRADTQLLYSIKFIFFQFNSFLFSYFNPFFISCLLLKEPGTDAQIKEFAKSYHAEFDMFSKIDVNGDSAHPLWKWLKEQPNGKGFMGK